jgi:hypothetical protein
MAHKPKSVRHLLKDKPTLKRLELEISAQKALLGEIRALLPGDLAPHCVAARARASQLLIYADSPAWATRLRFLAPQLTSLLQSRYPTLHQARVKLLISRGARAPRPRKARHSDAGARIIQESALNTNESGLREALLRLSRALKTGS